MAADTTEKQGLLMDTTMIVNELGVSRKVAGHIMRWCSKHGQGVVAPDDVRKVYVRRADVDAWLQQNTKKVA